MTTKELSQTLNIFEHIVDNGYKLLTNDVFNSFEELETNISKYLISRKYRKYEGKKYRFIKIINDDTVIFVGFSSTESMDFLLINKPVGNCETRQIAVSIPKSSYYNMNKDVNLIEIIEADIFYKLKNNI
jgi:hypothetical protein